MIGFTRSSIGQNNYQLRPFSSLGKCSMCIAHEAERNEILQFLSLQRFDFRILVVPFLCPKIWWDWKLIWRILECHCQINLWKDFILASEVRVGVNFVKEVRAKYIFKVHDKQILRLRKCPCKVLSKLPISFYFHIQCTLKWNFYWSNNF